ncbi:MAG: hypothetical protein WBD36_13200 [Bacteroidota bacterium]
MKNVLAYSGRLLAWIEPNIFKMYYELRSGDEVVATLQLKGVFKSTAVGESGEGSWTFERRGVLRHTVTIQPEREGATPFEFKQTSWKGSGTVELKNGTSVLLTRRVWSSAFEWTTSTGEQLVQFRMRGFFRRICEVEIRHKASYIQETPWLIMLAWYLTVMSRRDSARHAASG